MKKISSLLIILLLLLSLTLPALASQSQDRWVLDFAGLLSEDEIDSLNTYIQTNRDQLELEMVIVTTYGTGSKNIQQYADDFYDENGFGYGETNSGILLVLDMEAREWYMSTCGDAIYIFTDYSLDQMGEAILPWLSNGEYYDAFRVWLASMNDYVEAYRNHAPIDGYVQPDAYDSPYGEEIVYYNDFHIENPFPIALIIGLVAALVTIFVMRSRMNTAKLQKNAGNYVKEGSFHLRQHSDRFLYSRVTRQPRPKQTSSGGGSSVHRSSGGVRHGGRGGRF